MREMAFSLEDWLRTLPEAVGPHAMRISDGTAYVGIGEGGLTLRWHVAPTRRIALLALPRLCVSFEFEGLDAASRDAFIKRFDLYMHRGGG